MKKIFCLWLVVLLISCFGLAQDKDVQSMTLDEVIEQALKNNLDLQIEMTNPEISRALWSKSTAIFIPILTVEFRHWRDQQPQFQRPHRRRSRNHSGTTGFTMGLAQNLPLGGSLDVTLRNNRYSTNSRYSSYNPRYNSTLTFNLTQPLLKDFGIRHHQKKHSHRHEQSRQIDFCPEAEVIDLIYQTEEAYWNLVYSHQNLEVKEKSLQLAKDLLKQNEIQVRVGVSAPMDILTAQAEVAARESETLQARSQIQTYEENLRRILNISQMPAAIVPQDKPLFSPAGRRFQPIPAGSPGKEARYRTGATRLEEQEHRCPLLPQPAAARSAAHRFLLHLGAERRPADLGRQSLLPVNPKSSASSRAGSVIPCEMP